MAIVKLKKITLCGLSQNKNNVLQDLQKIGGLHLIPLAADRRQADIINRENAYDALKYLTQCANKRHQVTHAENFDFDDVISQVCKVKTKFRELTDERDFLTERIKEILPWGDFALPRQGQLDDLKLWFYIVPYRLMKKVYETELIWRIVHKDNLYCYVVVLSATEPLSTNMPVPRTHTGKTPLSELHKRLNNVELQLEDMMAERESLTRWIWMITVHLVEVEDSEQLKQASKITLDRDDIFLIQAWVAERKLSVYADFARSNRLALLIEDPSPQDKPPTLLENTATMAGGEDVVLFYQTPNYYEWDPSAVVFFSFALFFAMILSDAGYAAIFGLFLLFKWKALGLTGRGQRLRMLGLVTIVVSLLWGMLIGSYFGYIPPPQTLPGFFKILDINDFSTMMHLSIVIGVLHIVLANLIKARQNIGKGNAFASVGWALIAGGGFIAWLGKEHEKLLLLQTGVGLLVFATLLLIVFSSSRPVKKPFDLVWRLLDGIISLTRITKIFGDVLSYMRLFALGLASASLALTFNQLAGQILQTNPGLGLLSGILILLVGHTLNIMLCLMSGVVHGLRLNFIEFYNWSMSDEGYPFKEFVKKGELK